MVGFGSMVAAHNMPGLDYLASKLLWMWSETGSKHYETKYQHRCKPVGNIKEVIKASRKFNNKVQDFHQVY